MTISKIKNNWKEKYEVEKVKLLEERIRKEGKALNETVLKVDSFINHQVDAEFMDAL